MSYHFFIAIEYCFPTLEFEEYDLPQWSLRESIEYDIVTPFPDKYHILRSIWEVRKGWEDLLIDLSEYGTTRALSGLLPDSLVFIEWYDPHDKNPDHKTKKSTEDEIDRIHLYFLLWTFHFLYSISRARESKSSYIYNS